MTVREILMWLANKDDTIDYDAVEKDIRKAVIKETSVGTEDTETYKKMVAKYVYWKGRYELAVRGMTDKAAVEIMGKEP
jgi:hypothetical protein